MNLHNIVRSTINAVNADENVYLIQALGQENVKGRLIPKYAAAEAVKAQIQTLSPDELQALNDTLRTAHLRNFYLYSDTYAGHKPQGQMRITGKPEDFIFRVSDGTFWKIYTVSEDFAPAGWVCVGAALQQQVPDEVRQQIPSTYGNK